MKMSRARNIPVPLRHATAGLKVAVLIIAASTASAAVTINSASALPNATAGANYSFTFTASGGVAPYVWAVAGNLPAGTQLDPNAGVLSGTPTQPGAYTFTVQVTDATKASALGNFSLHVAPAPLVITTLSPLFTGTVNSPYSQQFTASGGTPPYTWSITQGQTGALTLNPATGNLSGTPTTAGTFNFTVQVKDAAGAISQTAFSLTVNLPTLTVLTPAALVDGSVGTNYSQQLSASGGTPPYGWSVVNGAVPGLTLTSAGVLAGSPTMSGTYTLTIQVKDAAGSAASRVFSIIIAPSPLTITTVSPLPGGTAGSAFSQTMVAVGGAPPYTWSATGLPTGLAINAATGIISGMLEAAGSFSFTVRVTDANRSTFGSLFSLNVALPSVPVITVSGPVAQGQAASQIPVQITIDKPYSGPISGQLSITFAPTIQGATDPTIQFSTGGTTTTFTIPPGKTSASYSATASGSSSSSLALQTGTVAGTITLAVTATAFGMDVPPPPAQTISIASSAPVITQATLAVNGQTINVVVVGFSTTRQVSQAVFNFGISQGDNFVLQAGQFTVSVATDFDTWYANPSSSAFGSQFLFTQSFTVQGDPGVITLQSVALTNQVGTGTFSPKQ